MVVVDVIHQSGAAWRIDMERLTQKYESGAWGIRGSIDDAVMRLTAYEDTGLEPEEVLPKEYAGEIMKSMILLKEYQKLGSIDHLRELAQADKGGKIKAYVVEGFYCGICRERHERISEIEVYLTHAGAEAALEGKDNEIR